MDPAKRNKIFSELYRQTGCLEEKYASEKADPASRNVLIPFYDYMVCSPKRIFNV
jgi:hypothetical protein